MACVLFCFVLFLAGVFCFIHLFVLGDSFILKYFKSDFGSIRKYTIREGVWK